MGAKINTETLLTRKEAGTVGRFGLIGVAATLTHLGVAQAALALMPESVWLANLIGFVIAMLVGFFGHQYFTFGGKAPFWQAFWRYFLIAIAGFAVNNGVLVGLVGLGLVAKPVALTIAILVVPAGTFLASRFWGFRPAAGGDDAA